MKLAAPASRTECRKVSVEVKENGRIHDSPTQPSRNTTGWPLVQSVFPVHPVPSIQFPIDFVPVSESLITFCEALG